MTQSVENINKALANIKQYIEENHPEGAKVLVSIWKVRIFPKIISVRNRLAMSKIRAWNRLKVPKSIRQPYSDCDFGSEVSGSEELIPYLVREGIVASIGHTASKFQDVKKPSDSALAI